MNKQQVTPFALGAAAGAIVFTIAVFSSGWAVTAGVAEADARSMARTAVIESLSGICVAQFETAADRSAKLEKLIATDLWQRSGYVQDQGWATMPGSDVPSSEVAAACANRLAKLNG